MNITNSIAVLAKTRLEKDVVQEIEERGGVSVYSLQLKSILERIYKSNLQRIFLNPKPENLQHPVRVSVSRSHKWAVNYALLPHVRFWYTETK